MSLAFVYEVEPAPRLASVDALVLAFAWRPRVRSHCAGVPRPCPYVSCQHNTFLDITDTGRLRLNHGELEPHEVPAETSCALDIAAEGRHTWEAVGRVLGTTPVRAGQIYRRALAKLRLPMVDYR